MMDMRIYLSSSSPRRRELLHQIHVRFDLLLFRHAPRGDAAVDEAPLAGEVSRDYVVRLARAKAEHGMALMAMRHLPPRAVLAADTALDLDGAIMGKPDNPAQAREMLAALSGRSHRVLTAVAIGDGQRLDHVLSTSEVRFRALSSAEIDAYVASREPLDKAGAYGIQGRAAVFVEEIRGSHSGIVGLPLCETALLLRSFGYPI